MARFGARLRGHHGRFWHRHRRRADLSAKRRVSPDAAFSVTDWTAFVIFIVVIGGIGTIAGPIIGVIVFFLLQSLLADYGITYLIVLGALGIVIMLFAPRGIWGLISARTGIQLFPIQRRLLRAPPKTTGERQG